MKNSFFFFQKKLFKTNKKIKTISREKKMSQKKQPLNLF